MGEKNMSPKITRDYYIGQKSVVFLLLVGSDPVKEV
jgi:hypothetical protein